MLKGHTLGLTPEKARLLVLFFTIAACVALTFYVGFIMGQQIVYPHFFYIPIILAGLWYHRKAIYAALFLSVVYILITHLSTQIVTLGSFERCVILIAVAYIIGLVSEKRAKVQEELRRTRDYLDSLIRYANAPVIVWNPEFRITLFNYAFERLTGYTADEVIGQELSMLLPEASQDESRSKIARTLSANYWELVEIPILCKNGSVRLALWNSANIYALDGKTLQATIAQGIDITERKQAEEKIRQQNEFLNNVLESLTYPFYVIDAKDYTIKLANSAGGLGSLSKNSTYYALTHERSKPCGASEHPCPLEEVKKTKKPIVVEHIHYDEDGNVRNVEVHAYPISDSEGNVAQIIEYYVDISASKRAKEALVQERDLLQALIGNIPDSIYFKDEKSRFIRVNKAKAQHSGTTPEDMVGKTDFDFFSLEQANKMLEDENRVIESNRPLVKKVEKITHKDGTEHWVSTTKIPRHNENGEVIGTMGISRDMTERKKIEEALRTSAQQWRATFDAISDPISLLDSERRILRCNIAMKNLLGKPFREIIGRTCCELVDCRPKPLKECPFLYMQQTHRRETLVLPIGDRWFNDAIDPLLDEDSNLIGAVHIMSDITERKKVEETLMQSEKLKVLGEMAGGVAHDFNNLLAIILGNAQLLEKGVERYRLEEIKKRLRIIARTAYEGGETVRRLQYFTQREISREDFTKIDLNEIVREAITSTSPRWKDEAEAKGITIKIKEELGKLPPLLGSRSELMEVLTNFIFNALEAMPEGGEITIKTEAKENEVLLYFSDSGKGISDRIKDRIFDPFFTTKGPKASGLGLSVSYGIIKHHHGKIKVESIKGKGATFTISIPICLQAPQDEGKLKDLEKISSGKILVIDDEEGIREVLGRIFQDKGHRVTLAKTSRKGLDKFKQDNFDLVLTDLGMPEMSGWELAKKIKEIDPGTPVGLITGWAVANTKENMKKRGVDFILSKPFDYNKVIREVHAALESKKR